MGVPAFYRWLSTKYPRIIVDCLEDVPTYVGDEEIPVDTTQPNPNNLEFDNLYLDMNGIIHPCFHPEDRPPPTTEKEVFLCIFDYIDRLFGIVRPRKLLYMAIDGVAPRAKMNQQRSRRFKAAQDAREKEEEEEKLRQQFEKEGINLPRKGKNEVFDSNTITPGTPFMHRLSVALQYYVHLRLNSDPGWRDIMVILSDANVPGEGEHKIMSFVREQRGRPGWNPATRHCLYGLDADLIMLGLATHEPRFVILREVITQPNKGNHNSNPSQLQQDAAAALSNGKPPAEEQQDNRSLKPYQFLMINILREYLAMELAVQTPFAFDIERVYDDFVFMCFFVGNDFLPHMPTLDIREGAIELLMQVYKQELPRTGYLTDGAEVLLEPVEKFIQVIGGFEDVIFQKRMRLLQRDKRRRAQDRNHRDGQNRADSANWRHGREHRESSSSKEPNRKWTAAAPNADFTASLRPVHHQPGGANAPVLLEPVTGKPAAAAAGPDNNKRMADRLRDHMRAESALGKRPGGENDGGEESRSSKRPRSSREIEEETETPGRNADAAEDSSQQQSAPDPTSIEDKQEAFTQQMSELLKGKGDLFDEMVVHEESIRLGDPGWKSRYYEAKTGKQGQEQEAVVRSMVQSYVEGLAWVMKYYYDGVASWTWYYPFHYAPFASDLRQLAGMSIEFQLGEPFKPFNQLMGVLPAASAHALPAPFQPLFSSQDSPIIDFYPLKFQHDMNGKRFAWQAVVLLPFIDERRLLSATGPLETQLSEEEKWRNGRRLDQLYIGPAHPLCPDVFDLGSKAEQHPEQLQTSNVDPHLTGGLGGSILASAGEVCPMLMTAPFQLGEDISSNGVCCIAFRCPPHQKHASRLLDDQRAEPAVLHKTDLLPPKPLWHEDTRGRHHGPGQQGQQAWNHNAAPFYPNGWAAGRMPDHFMASAQGAPTTSHPQAYAGMGAWPPGGLNPHAQTFQPYNAQATAVPPGYNHGRPGQYVQQQYPPQQLYPQQQHYPQHGYSYMQPSHGGHPQQAPYNGYQQHPHQAPNYGMQAVPSGGPPQQHTQQYDAGHHRQGASNPYAALQRQSRWSQP